MRNNVALPLKCAMIVRTTFRGGTGINMSVPKNAEFYLKRRGSGRLKRNRKEWRNLKSSEKRRKSRSKECVKSVKHAREKRQKGWSGRNARRRHGVE